MIFKLIDIKSCSTAKNPKTCIFVSSCPPSLIAHNIFSKRGAIQGSETGEATLETAVKDS